MRQAAQTTMGQTTGDLSNGMLPSVTYDREHSQITATVIVSWPAGSEKAHIEAPMIAVAKTPEGAAPWQLCWILYPDPATLDLAQFHPDHGIQLPGYGNSTPLGVEVGPSEPGSSEWKVRIENQAGSTSEFKYDIWVLAKPVGGQIRHGKIHDPTIVVTPEPMG